MCAMPSDDAGSATEDAAARAELGLGDNYYSTSAGQRERMLAATERLQKTSDRLQVGKQQLAETEVRQVPCVSGVAMAPCPMSVCCYVLQRYTGVMAVCKDVHHSGKHVADSS